MSIRKHRISAEHRIPVMTLTDFDKKVADEIVKTGSVKTAAHNLGVDAKLIYNRAYRLRKQNARAMLFHNRINTQRRRSPVLDRLWRPILTVQEEKQEEEEEEE